MAALLPAWLLAAGAEEGRRGHDLNISVDSRWPGGQHGGYHPIRIRITNAAAERTLTVRFSPQRYSTSENLPSVTRTVTLEQNATQQFTLSIPLVNGASSGALTFSDRGGLYEDLTVGMNLAARTSEMEEQPSLLVIASDNTIDLKGYEGAADFLARPATISGYYGGAYRSRSSSSELHSLVIPLTSAPEHWIDYSGLDLVSLSLGTLQRLPEAPRSAILEWVATGGTLIVYDVGSSPEKSAELGKALDLENRACLSPNWIPAKTQNWQIIGMCTEGSEFFLPPPQLKLNEQSSPAEVARQLSLQTSASDEKQARPEQSQSDLQELGKKFIALNKRQWPGEIPFSTRDLLRGRVCAFSGPLFPGSGADWAWLLRDVGTRRWNWGSRMGVDHRQPYLRFAEFLVPGLGEVPSKMFLLLITLFTIVIGPLNYAVLKRRKQLYLLIVTIPVIALLTSTALFGYALIADGLSIQSRLRSITVLDQRHREAISSCRMALYTGLPPWGGLKFSTRTAVLPIWVNESDFTPNEMEWTGEQHLSSGWLRSRTPTQYSLLTHRVERGRLEVNSKPGRGEPEVSNGFPWPIAELLLKGADGKLYRGSAIAPGATVTLQKTTAVEVMEFSRRVGPLVTGPQPVAVSPGWSSRHHSHYYGNGNWNMGEENTLIPVDYSRGLAEEWMQRVQSNPQQNLAASSYVAIFNTPPGLDLGLSSLSENASQHVLIGYY